MRISEWSSDVCSSDLGGDGQLLSRRDRLRRNRASFDRGAVRRGDGSGKGDRPAGRRDDVAAVAVVVKPGARTGGRASDQRAAGTEVEVVAGVEVGEDRKSVV